MCFQCVGQESTYVYLHSMFALITTFQLFDGLLTLFSSELSESLKAASNVALCVQFNLAADDTPRIRLSLPGG